MKKTGIITAVLIILLSMALRVNAPRADLPSHITFSGSILTDEGNQCHNSRSKALYGEWFPDDWRITNYNPILPWIKYGIFKIFGVGMTQLRLVNYIFAFFSLLFFFLTLRSYFRENPHLALLGTFLLGINFFFVMYNKIATFETSITFWVILTLYFLEKFRSASGNSSNSLLSKQNLFLFLSGASAFMAFIFKSIMLYLLPLPFAAYVLMMLFKGNPQDRPPLLPRIKQMIKPVLIILAGMLTLLIPWYLFHYLPNQEWIISAPGQYMGKLMLPPNLDAVIRNFLSFPWKDQFFKTPVIWIGAVLYIPVFIRRLLRRDARVTEIGFFLFFIFHTFLLLVLSYRPTRYFIPVIPVMVFLTVLLFQRILDYSRAASAKPPAFRPLEKITLFAVDTVWLILAAYFCLLPFLGRVTGFIPRPRLSLVFILAAGALVAAAYALKSYLNTNGQSINKTFKNFAGKKTVTASAVILLSVIATVSSLGYYLDWNSNKTYAIRDISLELDKKLENAYIGGMTAPAAVLENKHKTLWLYPNFVNWDDTTFKKYPLTHVLLGTDVSREIHHFYSMWHERMYFSSLIKIYPIKNYSLHLYSFEEPYIKLLTVPGKTNSQTGKENDAEGIYEAIVFNPSNKTKHRRISQFVLSNNHPPQFIQGTGIVAITPGHNRIPIIPNLKTTPQSFTLVFIDRSENPQNPGDKNFTGHTLRYESENLPGRSGKTIRIPAASNGKARYYNPRKHPAGFLSYGPAVPFSTGLIIADFHITFENKKSKLKPLAHIDIFSHKTKKPLTQLTIKPSDVKKAASAKKPNTYRIHALITQTDTLEFRIKTENLSEITFDYVDLHYYQGIVFDSH